MGCLSFSPSHALPTFFDGNIKEVQLLLLYYFQFFAATTHGALVVALSEKSQVPFGTAIGNEELMHECFPNHSRMGTARMK